VPSELNADSFIEAENTIDQASPEPLSIDANCSSSDQGDVNE
jgi:hypothetical protein